LVFYLGKDQYSKAFLKNGFRGLKTLLTYLKISFYDKLLAFGFVSIKNN